ncbi:hypothetical protein GE061_000766 [Apolygus lucorum]|uniref:Uncharacterized protein n=1 Tax=Apolygus lucorum TaxID=248454 RepID=A0A8S9Y6F9_APOLU|nr:hypothetical protein GE061_000766 [Apolygus lucorum]
MMNSSFNTINKTLPKVTKQEAATGGSTSLTELDEMGQEDLKYLKCMKETLTAMLAATKKQPNISQIVKDGLNTMEEMCDALVTQEKRRTSVQKRLKAEVDKLTKWSPSKERSHGSRKRRKEDETDLSNSEEDCMETETSSHVVSDSDTAGVPFEKVKSRKGRQDLAKEAQRKAAREARRDADRIRRIKQQAEVEAQKKEADKKRKESEEKRRAEQDGRRKRKEAVKRDMQRNLKRSQALVIKVSDQISYAEVLQKLKDKVNPAEMNTEIRKIRRTGGGDVLLEVEPTSTISDAFKKAVENAVGEGLVKDLKPRASIEIRDLDPLTTAEERLFNKMNTRSTIRNQEDMRVVPEETREEWMVPPEQDPALNEEEMVPPDNEQFVQQPLNETQPMMADFRKYWEEEALVQEINNQFSGFNNVGIRRSAGGAQIRGERGKSIAGVVLLLVMWLWLALTHQ